MKFFCIIINLFIALFNLKSRVTNSYQKRKEKKWSITVPAIIIIFVLIMNEITANRKIGNQKLWLVAVMLWAREEKKGMNVRQWNEQKFFTNKITIWINLNQNCLDQTNKNSYFFTIIKKKYCIRVNKNNNYFWIIVVIIEKKEKILFINPKTCFRFFLV